MELFPKDIVKEARAFRDNEIAQVEWLKEVGEEQESLLASIPGLIEVRAYVGYVGEVVCRSLMAHINNLRQPPNNLHHLS